MAEAKEKKTRAAVDPELKAMGSIARVMGTLTENERQSVVAWVARKFGGSPTTTHATPLENMRFK